MFQIKIAVSGFSRSRKKYKNFTVVLITSYVLIVFFISVLYQMKTNVRLFWVDSVIGGNILTTKSSDFFDFYTPSSITDTFSYSDFLKQNQNTGKNIFAPRLRCQSLVEGVQSVPVITNGVNLELEQRLGNHIVLENGRYFEDGKNEIMISYALASTLGLKLGDNVSFTVMTQNGYPSYELLKLVGYLSFENVSTLFGDNIAYMSLPVLQKLCGVSSDEITEIATNVKYKIFIHGNYDFYKGEKMISISKLVSIAIIILEILLIISFGCFLIYNIVININTIIREKNKEIKVYLTFGAEPAFIRTRIFLEFFFYSTYCVLIGAIVCTLLIKLFNSLGFYSIDVATEMLMSSSQFVIKLNPVIFLICYFIIGLLMALGSIKTVIQNTSILSLKTIEKDE